MSSVKIAFVQKDGTEQIIESGSFGASLMQLAKACGVKGIFGDCGGGADCGTCHVYVAPNWIDVVGAPDSVEAATLELYANDMQANSRLSCQIKLNPNLDGLRLVVATA